MGGGGGGGERAEDGGVEGQNGMDAQRSGALRRGGGEKVRWLMSAIFHVAYVTRLAQTRRFQAAGLDALPPFAVVLFSHT